MKVVTRGLLWSPRNKVLERQSEHMRDHFYSSGMKLSAEITFPDLWSTEKKYPAIVLNNGYTGNKEEYDATVRALTGCGFITLQFDSRGTGQSEGVKGRMMCGTEWIEDIDCAVTYISHVESVDMNRIAVVGCSMGGALAVVAAAKDKRIKCVVAMCAFSDGESLLQDVWTKRKGKEKWMQFLNEIEEDNINVIKGCKSKVVSAPYALCMNDVDSKMFFEARNNNKNLIENVPLESVRNSFINLRPVDYVDKIRAPILYIHGSADYIIDKNNSVNLYEKTSCKKELKIIKGAPHPLPLCEQKEEVFSIMLRWLEDNL